MSYEKAWGSGETVTDKLLRDERNKESLQNAVEGIAFSLSELVNINRSRNDNIAGMSSNTNRIATALVDIGELFLEPNKQQLNILEAAYARTVMGERSRIHKALADLAEKYPELKDELLSAVGD